MIQSKVLIAGATLSVIAAFAVAPPVQAGGCIVVSAKARGLSEAAATERSHKKLTRKTNRWALGWAELGGGAICPCDKDKCRKYCLHVNKITAVRVGPTACSKGALAVCTSSAKLCP